MSAAPDFATRRFQSAAAHYLAGRAPYPPALIARVVELLQLEPDDRVMDLGCGPAQLAVGFAPYVGEVLALDPEPAMLELAREAASQVPNVEVVQGGSQDIGAHLGRFRAAVIGRAFHWMDRAETLRRFDDLLEPDGAVVLFGDERPKLPENAWLQHYSELIERFSADDEDRQRRRSEAFAPHMSVLLHSPFSRLERASVVTSRELGVDGLVQRALSQSSTSRARLGAQADEMVAELRAKAPAWSPTGRFTEVLFSNALIARRPTAD
jgi:SAM-dependent methyltransferase